MALTPVVVAFMLVNARQQRPLLMLFPAPRKLVIKIESFAAARGEQGVDAVGFITEIGNLHCLFRVGILVTAEHIEEVAIAAAWGRRLKRLYPSNPLTHVVGRCSAGIFVRRRDHCRSMFRRAGLNDTEHRNRHQDSRQEIAVAHFRSVPGITSSESPATDGVSTYALTQTHLNISNAGSI